jgi:hypothetical protein
MPRFIAFHLPFFIIYSVSLFIRISRRLLKSGYSVDIACVNDDRRGHAIHNRNGNGAIVAYSGALLFEHRRLRPLARISRSTSTCSFSIRPGASSVCSEGELRRFRGGAVSEIIFALEYRNLLSTLGSQKFALEL